MFTKNNLAHLILLSIPLWVLCLSGIFLIPQQADFIREVCNFTLLTAFFYALCFLISSVKLKAIFSWIIAFILSFLLLIKLNFYHIYQVKLSASALFVIFETNAQETSEFLEVYISSTFLFLAGIFILYLLGYGYSLFKRKIIFQLDLKPSFQIILKVGLLGLAVLSAYLIHWKFSEFNILYTTKTSYADYKTTKKLIKETLAQPTSPYLKEVKKDRKTPKIGVVIIGESTNRNHMSLYGYYRNTNPLLAKQKELWISKDVITPHVHTVIALDKILTLNSFENKRREDNASVIQLANQAGYKTFWLSNQRPVGINESVPTLIGYAATEKIFLNTDNYNRKSYDEVLLPAFNEALQDPAPYKMIFLHLSGTHLGYQERYPNTYQHFKDTPKTKFQHERAYGFINQYDNAIRYNDYIINDLLEQLKAQQTSSYMIYFSDHGDDVFDDYDNAGHSEDIGTNGMFEIPYITWVSPHFKEQLKSDLEVTKIENRKYLLDEFIHAFADLSQISFDGLDKTKSIYDSTYVEKPRLIKGKIDYDAQKD
ncbi:sulfatase-like hydrolase/transferase [Mesonia sp.]|uniref:sulfatase-like hydrolase/transferase n=1 Tax=Mesonia sp. TaxID=1960830 RepID=UPI003F9C1ACC